MHAPADGSTGPSGQALATLAARLLTVSGAQVWLPPGRAPLPAHPSPIASAPVGRPDPGGPHPRRADLTPADLTTAEQAPSLLGPAASIDRLCQLVSLTASPVALSDAAGGAASTLLGLPTSLTGAFLGVPLPAAGPTAGALCVFDPRRRRWQADDLALLQQFAVAVAVGLTASTLQTQLQETQVVFGLAVDAAGIGTFDWDLVDQRITCSDQLLALFGLTPRAEPWPVEAFNTLIHPQDRPQVDAALRRAAAQRVDYEVEYRLSLPGGVTRWLATRGRLLRNDQDRPVRLLGASHDRTAERVGAAQVSRVLDPMPAPFLSMDRTFTLTYVNDEAVAALGVPRTALLGSSVWELFPGAVGTVFQVNLRRAMSNAEPVTFQAFYGDPYRSWFEVRAWPTVNGLSVYFLDVTARVTAQTLADQGAARWALLAEVTEALLTTLDGEESVGRLAPLLVPALADWCILTVLDDDGAGGQRRNVRDVGASHHDPAAQPLVQQYCALRRSVLPPGSPVDEVLRTGLVRTGVNGADHDVTFALPPGPARELVRRLAPASYAILPLRGRGHTLGALSLFNGRDRGPLSAADLATAGEVADRAGMSLDNARLFAQQRHLAEALQRSLLSEPTSAPELEVVVRYGPAAEASRVGGDWYDAFTQRDGASMVVIGDVAGHDAAAAAAMGQLRALLRGIAARTGDGPARVLAGVDEAVRTLGFEVTATAVVARVTPDPARPGAAAGSGAARLSWSNAGHPPPMLLLGDGTVQVLERADADLMLGIDDTTGRTESTATLPVGATVLLYTDGLVERRGHSLDEGLAVLRTTLAAQAGQGLDQLCDRVLAALLPAQAEDDVALLAFRWRP